MATSKLSLKEEEAEHAKLVLKARLPMGKEVYTVLRHVTKSGMSRSISLFIVENEQIVDLTYFAARALDCRIDPKHGGVIRGGCGMDMGYDLVMSLSYLVHGYASKGLEGTNHVGPSNATPERFHAGYTLIQRWL